jgi:hypothetical protein
MWCFFDESYPNEGGVTSIICCLMRTETVSELDRIMYAAQHRHLGKQHAKDLEREVKGTALLSNASFKMLKKYGHSTNQSVAQDILREVSLKESTHEILVFGAAVYGARDLLKNVGSAKLSFPLVEILKRVSVAGAAMEPQRKVHLVFDESLTDRRIAMSIRRFVAGVRLANVSPFPLVGVSHVSPGIQFADLGAFILGRRAVGDVRFKSWITRLRKMEWSGNVEGRHRLGIQRWDGDKHGRMTVRKKWE